RSQPPPHCLRPHKTLGQRFLRGELSCPSTRRFQCPTWLCFVVVRADRSLQFSSRPPSSRAFGFGYRKSLLEASRGRRTYVIALSGLHEKPPSTNPGIARHPPHSVEDNSHTVQKFDIDDVRSLYMPSRGFGSG